MSRLAEDEVALPVGGKDLPGLPPGTPRSFFS
jgi:hypothetical protein